MVAANYEFEALSTREGFNRSLRHFKNVGEIISGFEQNINLADILNAMVDEKRLEAHQLPPIVHALLVGHPRYPYLCHSHNLTTSLAEFEDLAAETRRWQAVDLVIQYSHPDMGFCLVNPKNPQHWNAVQALKKNEHVTVYAGLFTATGQERVSEEALENLIGILDGKKIRTSAILTRSKLRIRTLRAPAPVAERPALRPPRGRRPVGRPERRKAAALPAPVFPAARTAAAAVAPATAVPARAQRMTPMYSIPVTNELFHNGNVEAWKRIIQSYNAKHPGLEVFIFYEGERIHDINTLFKWGKVKHGSSIIIAVSGDDIQDVAKLQRYLRQGASHMFEAFLRFPVNTVLNLF